MKKVSSVITLVLFTLLTGCKGSDIEELISEFQNSEIDKIKFVCNSKVDYMLTQHSIPEIRKWILSSKKAPPGSYIGPTGTMELTNQSGQSVTFGVSCSDDIFYGLYYRNVLFKTSYHPKIPAPFGINTNSYHQHQVQP